MRLVIPIQEVQEFLANYYHIDIELKNIATDKIQASYFKSVVLILKQINDDEIMFNYEAGCLVNFFAKIAHLFLAQKLKNIPIEWNSKNKSVTVKLRMIPQINEFQKFVEISKLHFTDDNILLLMFARDKNSTTELK